MIFNMYIAEDIHDNILWSKSSGEARGLSGASRGHPGPEIQEPISPRFERISMKFQKVLDNRIADRRSWPEF